MNRIGDWIQTYTGKRFYPLDPRTEEIDIEDIAHALSNQCRFAGHVKTFYSVAEHSVRVATYLLSLMGWNVQRQDVRRIALTALLHDASEAYLTDIHRPIKRNPQMSFYVQAERNLEHTLATKYDLIHPYPTDIHKADNILLITERRDLLTIQRPDWDVSLQTITPLPDTITPLSPFLAKQLFSNLFALLHNPPQVVSDRYQAFIISALTTTKVNPGLQRNQST
jgi:uncharacterized protein